jgi:hypothetical protein
VRVPGGTFRFHVDGPRPTFLCPSTPHPIMSTAIHPATPAFVTRRQLLEEAGEMLRYASAVGIAAPAPVVQTVDAFETAGFEDPGLDLRPLVSAHGRLVKLVAPAAPGTLVFMARTRKRVPRFGQWLGPVPLVRRMAAAALVSLAVFILLSIAQGSSAPLR